MKYQALQAVLILGDRIEKGQVVDIRPDLAQSIGVLYLKPLEEVQKEEVKPVQDEKPLEDMTRAELIEVAKAKGLATYGTKAELLERLVLSSQ